MFTRREMIAAGLVGSVAGPPAESAASESLAQDADREGQREIAGAVRSVSATLDRAFTSNLLSFGTIGKIRDVMHQYFRSTGRFPDFMDIGYDVFLELYDWHIRHNQQLLVSRAADGRYTIQFMFTTMVLRQEVDPGHLGVPYEKG